MFTGIVECLGTVEEVQDEKSNRIFVISSPISRELKIDQSLAHDGVCLTVTEKNENTHRVVAIDETLQKTTLGHWKKGTKINLERCMQVNGRLDGHIVQGHVDTHARCIKIEDQNGSWKYWFEYPAAMSHITVEKGSVTINGTSLTVVDSRPHSFSVCIIPYTWENTNFRHIADGDFVNIEFDIIGKYVARLVQPIIS